MTTLQHSQALLNVCTPGEPGEPSLLGGVPFDAIELHVRYDAMPWNDEPMYLRKREA